MLHCLCRSLGRRSIGAPLLLLLLPLVAAATGPIRVVVSPWHTELSAGQTIKLSATVFNDGGDQGVVWELVTPAVGTLRPLDDFDALYTAPAVVSHEQLVRVKAMARADRAMNGIAAVTLGAASGTGAAAGTGTAAAAGRSSASGAGGPWTAAGWGLTAFQDGLDRDGRKAPPWNLLSVGGGWYQSGLLIFQDPATHTEIWRLDDDGEAETAVDGPLNRPYWNANGTLFQVWSNRCLPGVYCGDKRNFLYSADGSRMELADPIDPTRHGSAQNRLMLAPGGYLPWSPTQPGIFYVVSSADTSGWGVSAPDSALYAVDALHGFRMTKIVDLPRPQIHKEIQSYPAPDGLVMVKEVNPPDVAAGATPAYIPRIYMIDANPASSNYGRILYQYSIALHLTQFAAAGHQVANEYHIHDIYFRRTPDDAFILNYGPKGNVGEGIFFQVPVDGDSQQVRICYPGEKGTPDGTPYYSHPAWDRNGRLVAYDGENLLGSNHWGVNVRDQDDNQTMATLSTVASGHIGWDGDDKNFIAFDGPSNAPGSARRWGVFSADPLQTNSARLLVDEGPRPESAPSMVEGPGQSPDGTKVLFTVQHRFVAGSHRSTYIAVDHRPLPPELLGASGTSVVTLRWNPYPAHREVVGYHVYRRQGGGPFVEVSSALVKGTVFTDTKVTRGGDYQYAVTAQEASGLESDQLSNILDVRVGGSWKQAAPAGTTGWDKQRPQPPMAVQATLIAPYTYRLSWTASRSANVRYYQIFYGDGAAAKPIQADLVATPMAGTTQWIYWQAKPGAPASFGMTAVDRQDQVSTMVRASAH